MTTQHKLKTEKQTATKTSKKTRIKYEQGQCVMCVWGPVKEGEVAKETDKVLKGNRFAILAAESEAYQAFARRV